MRAVKAKLPSLWASLEGKMRSSSEASEPRAFGTATSAQMRSGNVPKAAQVVLRSESSEAQVDNRERKKKHIPTNGCARWGLRCLFQRFRERMVVLVWCRVAPKETSHPYQEAVWCKSESVSGCGGLTLAWPSLQLRTSSL
jgi:hypothetical protein